MAFTRSALMGSALLQQPVRPVQQIFSGDTQPMLEFVSIASSEMRGVRFLSADIRQDSEQIAA
jgi:hypothetical protein